MRTPDGWTSAAPETPGAVEDLNRLIAEGVWVDAQQRYQAPGTDPGPAAGGDAEAEG